MGGRAIVLAIAILAVAHGGHAHMGLSSDAGSGHDSGPLLPVPIELNATYSGTLDHTSDVMDSYTFHAEGGTILRLTIDNPQASGWLTSPHGRTEPFSTPWQPAGVLLIVEYPGEWRLDIQGALPHGRIDYTFTLHREPLKGGHYECPSVWCAFDIALTNATYSHVRLSIPFPSEASALPWLYHLSTRAEWGTSMTGAGASGFRATIGAPHVGVVDIPSPTTETHHTLLNSFAGVASAAPADLERRIHVALLADFEAPIHLAYATDGDIRIDRAEGDDVVTWTTSDLHDAVISPAFVHAGPHTTARTLGSHFEGWFGDLDRKWSVVPTTGRIIDPHGTTHEMPNERAHPIFPGSPEGTWSLEIDGATRAGMARGTYLWGVDFPAILTPWRTG